MNNDAPADREYVCIPSSAAEAWAAVYMDVAEKLEAEDKAITPAVLTSVAVAPGW